MPRPDLTTERTEQILDAFERCIVKYGLEGSSLEKIGEEAGMKRTILRHYIGNREDLIRSLCGRVVSRWSQHLRALERAPLGANPREALMGYLFDDLADQSGEAILVAENLIAAAERYPFIGDQMRGYMGDLTDVLSGRLALIYPESKAAARWQVAYGLTSILFNDSSLATLGLPPKYRRAARGCAAALIDSLA